MKHRIGGHRFIIAAGLTSNMKPRLALEALRTSALTAGIPILPFYIKQVLPAIVFTFKELIELINRYSLKHTKLFSAKLLIILVLIYSLFSHCALYG
jgi:hypothetical protein